MFADDVKLYYSYEFPNSIMQLDIDALCKWCDCNLLNLNSSKCKQMTFTRRPFLASPQSYQLCGAPLLSVEQFNDLGVLMDTKLTFNAHIDRMVCKSHNVLGLIKRWAKEFTDPYVTKLLFTSLVRPILEYASPVWNPFYDCHINRIESVQKQFLLFCLRNLNWCCNHQLPSYESRLKLIALPTLKSRKFMLNVTFIHKLLSGDIRSPRLLE